MSKEINLAMIDAMVNEYIRKIPKNILALEKKVLFFSRDLEAHIWIDFLEKINQHLGDNVGIIVATKSEIMQQYENRDLFWMREPDEFAALSYRGMKIDIAYDVKDWFMESEFQNEYANIQRRFQLNDNEAIALTCFGAKYMEKVLSRIQPDAVMVLTEYEARSLIIAKGCEKAGVQVLYLEYGVLPGSYALDGIGQMGESYPAVESESFSSFMVNEQELEDAKSLREYFLQKGLNRSKKPQAGELDWIREQLKEGRPTIVCFGQNDLMSGIFPYTEKTKKYHSPIYTSSDEAACHLAEIAKQNNWNIIYKPHPIMVYLQDNRPKFPDNLIYVEKVNLNEIIDLADLTVTILSTTAYDASIRKKPVLMLGYNQICHKGCVYEAFEKEKVELKLKEALYYGYTEEMDYNFIKHIAQLRKYYLYDDLFPKAYIGGKNIQQIVQFIKGHLGNGLNCNWVKWKKTDAIAIWGTGIQAQEFMEKYFETSQIDAVIDNNKDMHGKTFWGREILHPRTLMEKRKKIIICCAKWKEVSEQLDEMGYRAYEDYIPDWILDIQNEISYDDADVYDKVAFIRLQKKIITFWGNNQVSRLTEKLEANSEFTSNYFIVRLPLINQITQWQEAVGLNSKMIQQLDVFVTQYIAEDNEFSTSWNVNYLRTILPSSCRMITIPALYFAGYYPQQGHIEEYEKKIREKVEKEFYVNDVFPEGDMFIEQLYSEGKSVDEIVSTLKNTEFLSREYVEANVEKSLAELEKIEKKCDVKMADYIRENYRKTLLFHSNNQPVGQVLNEFANCLLKYMGYSSEVKTSVFEEREINNQMIYSTVKKHLELPFRNDFIYCAKPYYEEPLLLDEYVKKYIKRLLIHLT